MWRGWIAEMWFIFTVGPTAGLLTISSLPGSATLIVAIFEIGAVMHRREIGQLELPSLAAIWRFARRQTVNAVGGHGDYDELLHGISCAEADELDTPTDVDSV